MKIVSNKLILILGLVIIIGSFLSGIWRGKEDGQKSMVNMYFEGKRQEFGELFYDTKVAVGLQGTLADKKDNVWTVKSQDQKLSKDILMDKDSIYIQTGEDPGNISQWQNIMPEEINTGDQIIINVYLNPDNNSLYGFWVKKIK